MFCLSEKKLICFARLTKIECDEGEWRNFIQEPTSQQKLFLCGEIAYTDIWEDKWVTGFAWCLT
jgi:hypothetical protein